MNKKIVSLFVVLVSLFLITGCFNLDGVESIEFKVKPQEMYEVGKGPSLDSLSINVKMQSSSSLTEYKLSNSGVTVLGMDFTTPGKKTVTVKYGGVTVSADYYVVNTIAKDFSEIVSKLENNAYVGLEGKVYEFPSKLIISSGNKLIGQTGTVIRNTSTYTSGYLIAISSGTIENIEITSSYPAGQGADKNVNGVETLGSSTDVSIKKSYIHNLRTAVGISQAPATSDFNISIEDNIISDSRTGILLYNLRGNVSIVRNKFVANKALGVLLGNPSGGTNTTGEFAKNLVIKKNAFVGNWYAEVESRYASEEGDKYVFDLSQNYFGTNGPNLITDALAQEPPHFSENGPLITRPVDNREGNVYAPSTVIHHEFHNKDYKSDGIIITSYYTDLECTNLVSYNPQS